MNTSGEESKFGVEPGEQCLGLCRHVHDECAHLELAGLMTIGMPDYTSRPENFECLRACRQQVASELGLEVRRARLTSGSGSWLIWGRVRRWK